MPSRPPLTLAGGDVTLVARLPCGRVRVAYVDRDGQPTRHTRPAWPHELRGIGWHLAEIKRAIAALPAVNPDGTMSPAPPQSAARPRAWLAAHHAADALSKRED